MCFLVAPAIIIKLCKTITLLSKIGVAILCYGFGIILGNIGIFPESFTSSMQVTLQDISIALAIPLILFSVDIKTCFNSSKKGLLCMFLAVVSVTIITLLLQFVFADYPHTAHLGAMSTGVYTGGTPNIAVIAKALDINQDVYMQFILYDTILGLVFFLFCCSIARPFYKKILKMPSYSNKNMTTINETVITSNDESLDSYNNFFDSSNLKGIMFILLLAILILGFSFLIASLFDPNYFMMILFILITSLSLVCSCFKRVRMVKQSFPLGMYIVYIFCFTIASMANLASLIHINWTILSFVFLVIFGSMIIHALLCKLCKIDVDTFIVVSVSAICSPPFVPVVATAIKNKEVLVTGMITGILGYAIGNYLGISMGLLFGML